MGLVRLNRGQLVLVAAAVVAVGLVPVLLAYLQLGYHPDTAPEPDVSGETADAIQDARDALRSYREGVPGA